MNKKGMVLDEELIWILMALLVLAIVVIAIIAIKNGGLGLIDKFKSILGGG